VRLSIDPIEPRFAESLKAHLAPFGLPPHIVEWKYFRRPWKDHLSGLVWHRDGQVRGAIGLIPLALRVGDETVSASWTCDWVVENPQANPGIGVVLLQKAKTLAGPLLSLGGNELNRRLMGRIASASHLSAAVELYLPIRVGGSRRFRGLNRRSHGALEGLRWFSVAPRSNRFIGLVTPGVSPRLESVLLAHGAHPHGVTPQYDLTYLRWQLDACPDVEPFTVMTDSSTPSAAALVWHRKSVPTDWRFSMWSDGGEEASILLDAMREHASGAGAERLCVLVSRSDTPRLRLLQDKGFRSDEPDRPLFVTGSLSGSEEGLNGLSFLDTDLAYRI
jgi:hypothetical protein